MSKIVNMHEARATLSQLVSEVERGAKVILTRRGTPVAKLVSFQATRKRQLGGWKGKVRTARDFDARRGSSCCVPTASRARSTSMG